MTRTTMLAPVLRISLVAALAGPAAAQRAAPAPPPPPPSDGLTDQDRDMRDAATQLAADATQAIEQWLIRREVTEDRLFSRLYFPIPKTDPTRYATSYDALADRHLVALEAKARNHRPTIEQYAIVTDENGYVPADEDHTHNRSKRLLGDPASLRAARSEAGYLLQRTEQETGEVIYDLSVPITVRGKHWGCARIGYRRAE